MRYSLLISIILNSILCIAQAPPPQWTRAAFGLNPGDNLEEMIFDRRGNAYIAASNHGVLFSSASDVNHTSWTFLNTGLQFRTNCSPYPKSKYVGLGIAPDGTVVVGDFTCGDNYWLNNVSGNGQVWTQATPIGVNHLGMLNYGCDVAKDHQTLMCGFDDAVHYTRDNGRSWQKANMNGINTGEFLGVFSDPVSGVAYAGFATKVGVPAVVFSTDNGSSWNGIPRDPTATGDGDNAAVNIMPMGPFKGYLIASRSDNKTGLPTILCYGPNPASPSAAWTNGCVTNADSVITENGCMQTAWLVRNRTNNRLLRAMFVNGGYPTYTDDGVSWAAAASGLSPDPTETCTKQPDIQSLTIDPTTGKAWFVTNKTGEVYGTTLSQDIGTGTKPNPPSNVKATPQ